MSSIVLHPATISARERVNALREELHDLFSRRIELRFDVIPRVRDRYAELFGDLERSVQSQTLELSERRRMVELFSLKLDRGQKLDARTVELVMKAVRNEFARVRGRMQAAFSSERRAELDEAWRPSANVEATPAPEMRHGARTRSEELRDLYRVLAKRLHPDVRADGSAPRREYWDLVQRGYHRGDLPLLRTLTSLIDTLGAEQVGPEAEAERLAIAVRTERAQIEALKRDELFHLGERMKHPSWVAGERERLERELADIEEEIGKCDRFLAPILSGQSVPTPDIVRNIWSSFVEDVYINNR